MFSFKLYVSGGSNRDSIITESVKKTLEMLFNDRFELRAFNLLENPNLAVEDNVLATPTLIKSKPEPIQRFVGDFTNISLIKDKLL